MSTASNRGLSPEPQILDIFAKRIEVYRAVANAALKLPQPIGGRKFVTPVANETLLAVHEALYSLLDHSEDLEVML